MLHGYIMMTFETAYVYQKSRPLLSAIMGLPTEINFVAHV